MIVTSSSRTAEKMLAPDVTYRIEMYATAMTVG